MNVQNAVNNIMERNITSSIICFCYPFFERDISLTLPAKNALRSQLQRNFPLPVSRSRSSAAASGLLATLVRIAIVGP
jgi:hypothetical protein